MNRSFVAPLRALLLAFSLAGAAACGKDDPTGPSQPGGGGTALLDVTNNSSVSIWYVRLRDCGSQSWGADLLGANIITAGLGQSFTVSSGCHDVRLETSAANNGEAVFLNVQFPSGAVVAKTVTNWTPKS